MMKYAFVWLLLFIALVSNAQQLPVWKSYADSITSTDWLVKPITAKATIYQSADGKDIILYNGLVKRTFRLQPNLTCTEYKNMSNGQQLLRAVMPEAKVIINGIHIMLVACMVKKKMHIYYRNGLIILLHTIVISILYLTLYHLQALS